MRNELPGCWPECPVGGLLLFNGGLETKESLARLQVISKVPLLVGSDVERGVGQQVKGYTLFPHLMAFGKLPERDAVAAVDRFARTIAYEARDVGIHIAFAPVADVNTNPRNPIIATRAFSEDPEQVAQLVAYFVDVIQSSGVIATAKHFPGHGDHVSGLARGVAERRAVAGGARGVRPVAISGGDRCEVRNDHDGTRRVSGNRPERPAGDVVANHLAEAAPRENEVRRNHLLRQFIDGWGS